MNEKWLGELLSCSVPSMISSDERTVGPRFFFFFLILVPSF